MVLSLLAAGCLLGLSAWYVTRTKPGDATEAPTSGGAQQQTPEVVSQQSDDVARKGVDFLASRQFEDGHWEGDDGDRPVAMTALAGIALLRGNEHADRVWVKGKDSFNSAKHSARIRKAADWLMAQSQAERDGLIFSDHPSDISSYMQGHGLATMFLAGVCENETDDARRKKLTEVLARAVTYIVNAQSTQGGWHDTSRVEGHDFATVPATALQVQALQAVEIAGLPIPRGSLQLGFDYLKASMEIEMGPPDITAAIVCLGQDGLLTRGDSAQKLVQNCLSRIPKACDIQFGRDESAHYWYAQAEHNLAVANRGTYFSEMSDRLRVAQNKDGSWPVGDNISSGRVYSTAIWCIALEVRNETHPARKANWVNY